MYSRLQIASHSALVAFEGVARLNAVGRAAEELNTSQSAISRHIKYLEQRLGVPLFDRVGRGVELTKAGEFYFNAVTSALATLRAAEQELLNTSKSVTIACTHEVSHLILMPKYEMLRNAIGRDILLRIVTAEYEAISTMVHAGADITIGYERYTEDSNVAVVMPEEVAPVAAPSFASLHEKTLQKSSARWVELPFLGLAKDNPRWASWADWFEAQGAGRPPTPRETFTNYVYLLEAAVSGAGIAIGWRGFVERYLNDGTLVLLTKEWLSCPRMLCARLTTKGTRSESAKACLTYLSTMPSRI